MAEEAPAAKRARTEDGDDVACSKEDEAGWRAAVEAKGRAFDYSFTGDKSYFDSLWRQTWSEFSEQSKCSRLSSAEARANSTADSTNRKRDKAALEERLGLQGEPGNAKTVLYNEQGEVLATGYVQILYGDHGDYFELLDKHINWSLFTEHKLKGPGRHYHEHRTKDREAEGSVQLYDQFNTVADEPNPPPGPKSQDNNRKEGYADYRPGVFYMPADKVKKIGQAAGL